MNPPEGGGDRNGATSRRSTHPRDPGPLRPRGDDEPERDDPIAVVNKNWTRHSHVLNVETGTVRGFEGAPLASHWKKSSTKPCTGIRPITGRRAISLLRRFVLPCTSPALAGSIASTVREVTLIGPRRGKDAQVTASVSPASAGRLSIRRHAGCLLAVVCHGMNWPHFQAHPVWP